MVGWLVGFLPCQAVRVVRQIGHVPSVAVRVDIIPRGKGLLRFAKKKHIGFVENFELELGLTLRALGCCEIRFVGGLPFWLVGFCKSGLRQRHSSLDRGFWRCLEFRLFLKKARVVFFVPNLEQAAWLCPEPCQGRVATFEVFHGQSYPQG